MNKRGNFKFAVFGVVFIIFMLFVFFRPDQSLTGLVTFSIPSSDPDNFNKFYTGQNINGSLSITIAASEKIDNETVYKLGLFSSQDSISPITEKSLTADEIFNKSLNLDKIKDTDGKYYFTKQS